MEELTVAEILELIRINEEAIVISFKPGLQSRLLRLWLYSPEETSSLD